MKSSDVNSMSMARVALSGLPGQGASLVSDIAFNGGNRIGYDCGIPNDPYAKDVNAVDPSNKGKHVLIGDMNKVLQLAGTGLYMRQRGGANEFDPRVVAIDKGAKPESGEGSLYGYPNGAVLDWWDGTTYRKVICVKIAASATDHDGNCTVGPDDPANGVNGTLTRYWKIVDIEPQKSLSYRISSLEDISNIGGTSFTKYARITMSISFTYKTPNSATSTATMSTMMRFYVRPGDTYSYSPGTSITINGKTFRPSARDILSTTEVTNVSMTISEVQELATS